MFQKILDFFNIWKGLEYDAEFDMWFKKEDDNAKST